MPASQDPYAKKFMKDEKFTKTDYIANSGGLLGLCMGFSLVSAAEIIYHCVIGIFSPFCRDQDEREKTDKKFLTNAVVEEEEEHEKNELDENVDMKHCEQPNYVGAFVDYETPELDTFSQDSHQPCHYDTTYSCSNCPEDTSITSPYSQMAKCYSRDSLSPCSPSPPPYGPYRHLTKYDGRQRHFTSPSPSADRRGYHLA